jgi:hypothetical protein
MGKIDLFIGFYEKSLNDENGDVRLEALKHIEPFLNLSK